MAPMGIMLANAIPVPCNRPRISSSPATARGGGGGLPSMMVECSSRPQKKATSHHMKTRPKKTQPWDVKRKGPTAYPPLPLLPPDWTVVSEPAAAQPVESAAPATAAAR